MTPQSRYKLALKDIAVVITSALYVDKLGQSLNSVDPFRLQRLQQTIAAIRTFQFTKIIVLDASLTDNFVAPSTTGAKIDFVQIKSTLRKHDNEYQVYGPSRLEIDLMDNARSTLSQLLVGYTHIIKLSAGYSVHNLDVILAKASSGVVYRFGNPLRRKVRFCLSSFYLLPTAEFLSFISYAAGKIDVVAKKYPLEAVLFDFIQTLKTQAIAIDYPVIHATFLSSQTNSDNSSFKIKLKIYQVLSSLGLYARAVGEIKDHTKLFRDE